MVSLEPWDAVWRRNQHLAAHLVAGGGVEQIAFLEPPMPGPRRAPVREPLPGIRAVPLSLLLPKRAGGLRELGGRLRRGLVRRADVLWVNDPALGVHCVHRGRPVVYDVTDDWRSYDFPPRIIRRIVRAEDALARSARTVVCSTELQRRWRDRYGVEAAVVHNGIDAASWRSARRREFPQAGPHVGYVGTLQAERLDLDLVLEVASDERVGTVHLIGPDALDAESRTRLVNHPRIALHPPVPAAEVPSWIGGMDVLISPHVISPFTLSLDAIKSYEYLASGRPIVATPTSGFQLLAGRPGVHVTTGRGFVDAVVSAPGGSRPQSSLDELDWSGRAAQFLEHLTADL